MGVVDGVVVGVSVGVTVGVVVSDGVILGVLDGQGFAILQSLHAPKPLYIVDTATEGISVVAEKVTTK